VPWAPDVQVVYEHYHRYLWAADLAAGRCVLDLGSGEGFGAALLAGSAARVLGIDVDDRTVEHSGRTYQSANLEFRRGDARSLVDVGDGEFDLVVAFELIEHLEEQQEVLGEIARVLRPGGILIMSTPDRPTYDRGRPEPNPYHKRELTRDELVALLRGYFPNVALWGQRTITGSHLHAVDPSVAGAREAASEFFLERDGDEWRTVDAPAPLYHVALASRTTLPTIPVSSTLSDSGLELMRVKEREAEGLRDDAESAGTVQRENRELRAILERERENHARELREHHVRARRERETGELEVLLAEERRSQLTLAASDATIRDLRAQLSAAAAQVARGQESVTWQIFERLRGRLYRTVGGTGSRRARGIGASLRLVGRTILPRSSVAGAGEPESIALPHWQDPEVSLVIPVHSNAPLTRACLRSIRDCTVNATYEVILVDDTADTETKDMLACVRGANVLVNETNLGFLASMNRGAAAARGRWLVLFNNDTEVTRGWLPAMVECGNSADNVAVVTPKFIYPDGSLNEAGGIVWRDGTAMNYGRGDDPDRFQYEFRRETDYGSAAALMVRADFWKQIGGFDERYRPIYYEDTDVCFQAREHGMKVLYEPRAVVVHVEGATSGTDPSSGAKRFQEINRGKFVAKWRERLRTEHLPSASANVRDAANRHRGPHVLVVDHRVPMWDRDSGSLRMFRIIRALLDLGARVTLMPDNLAPTQPYTRRLQRMGVEVLYHLDHTDVRTELERIGPGLQMAMLCRPHTASRWLDLVRELAPAAKVVYDTVDLHWLREARKGLAARADGGVYDREPDPAALWPKARALRELELALIRASDVTLVLNAEERERVAGDVPEAKLAIVPNVHDVSEAVPPAAQREGLMFVGSFEHLPNVDAALELVRDLMPLIWSEIGDVPLTIVGSEPPAAVRALASPLVDVAGWVEDLDPLLERSRVMVAPLRYGAGLKGKVTQALAAGLPVATTPIGAEGVTLREPRGNGSHGRPLLVSESPVDLARDVVRLYTDEALWRHMSKAGQAFIANHCSPAVLEDALSGLLPAVALAKASERT
jgi:GT2 family glycosyltransferase/SAM-dependent methyltransferase